MSKEGDSRASPAEIRRLVVSRHGEFDFLLSDVAAELGLSERKVQRVLSADGTTFRDLLLEVRMQHARRMIESSQLSLAAIAPKVGYRAPSGLRQAFIRYWGVPPGGFRSEWDLDAAYDRRYRDVERESMAPAGPGPTT